MNRKVYIAPINYVEYSTDIHGQWHAYPNGDRNQCAIGQTYEEAIGRALVMRPVPQSCRIDLDRYLTAFCFVLVALAAALVHASWQLMSIIYN